MFQAIISYLLRSHTDTVYGCALDPNPGANLGPFHLTDHPNMVTQYFRATIRIRRTRRLPDVSRTNQLVKQIQGGREADKMQSSRIACGFNSGCVRIFDVPTTTMPHEHQQHQGPVVQVLFDPSRGDRLYVQA